MGRTVRCAQQLEATHHRYLKKHFLVTKIAIFPSDCITKYGQENRIGYNNVMDVLA